MIDKLLDLIWQAYGEIHSAEWSQIDWTQDYDDEERSLSEDLERAIRKASDGFLPVEIQHSPFERESRKPAPAQPPQYDIAFVWTGDPRIMWPLEAKVLDSDSDTNENFKNYVDTVRDRYLTCYYAPFSNSGAMIAYLKLGDPENAAQHIAGRLSTILTSYSGFPSRCHKTSDHTRVAPNGQDYPLSFRLHHLIMPL